MTELFYPGHAETIKKGVHQVGLGTAATIAAYSLGAFLIRREKHLAFNFALALAIAGIEYANVRHHADAERG